MERSEVTDAVHRWAVDALPGAWTAGRPDVSVDNDEILVVITVPVAGDDDARRAIARFREGTRAQRISLAAEAEDLFERKVSWGARSGQMTEMFTIATVPVMTRLRFSERRTLDTLIDAGLARSRSEALAWCVRLVGANEQAWIAELRAAFEGVADIRDRGPRSTRPHDR
ncbi:MAG: hypothetical protein M3137_02935 [Actinomycetota bacterium]|nr:hypothetical protein [Actinomycetota bacterium]